MKTDHEIYEDYKAWRIRIGILEPPNEEEYRRVNASIGSDEPASVVPPEEEEEWDECIGSGVTDDDIADEQDSAGA